MAIDGEVKELMARGQGDQAATLVIRTLGPEILGYLSALLHDQAEASDVFSQFAEDVWRGLPGFRGESSLRTWVYRLARHAALRYKRDPFRKRGDRFQTTQASILAGNIVASTVVRHEWRAQQLARLRGALEEADQSLLILRVDRDMSWAEVADAMAEEDGVRPEEAALRKRFERLKDRLAKAAKEEGLLD
jgi:RNA polymerase sigma-70 factor (ECF subfamily)